MGFWYYRLKDESYGPVEKRQVIENIQSGLLGPLDFIYLEGENSWKAVIEYREFQPLLRGSNRHFVQKEWILLLQTKKEGHFNMDGPFSSFEVRQKIEAGQVRYMDYAWKSGMTEWSMISQLSQFNVPNKKRVVFPKVVSFSFL